MLPKQTDGQVGTSPASPPTVSAFFSKDNQLQVVVTVNYLKGLTTVGTLRVELMDKDEGPGPNRAPVTRRPSLLKKV